MQVSLGRRELLLQAFPRVAQVFFDELHQTQSLIHLANQNHATVGSHSRSFEIDLQGSTAQELKWVVLFLHTVKQEVRSPTILLAGRRRRLVSY